MASAPAPAAPKAQGKRKHDSLQNPSSSVVQDLDKQQQDHFCMLLAAAYNRPHRRQLDLGGPLYSNMYLEPVHAIQGSWDAVMWDNEAGFLIVQHASNVKHGLTLKYIEQLLQRIKQVDPMRSHPVHIMFAVPEHPPELFPAFAAQNFTEDSSTLQWGEVPQEVLDIPMWKIKLPMTPANLADAKRFLPSGTQQQSKERVQVMQICDMTAEQLRDEFEQQGKTVGGNKEQMMNKLLQLEGLLPYGVGTDEGNHSSSTAGLDADESDASSI